MRGHNCECGAYGSDPRLVVYLLTWVLVEHVELSAQDAHGDEVTLRRTIESIEKFRKKK